MSVSLIFQMTVPTYDFKAFLKETYRRALKKKEGLKSSQGKTKNTLHSNSCHNDLRRKNIQILPQQKGLFCFGAIHKLGFSGGRAGLDSRDVKVGVWSVKYRTIEAYQ